MTDDEIRVKIATLKGIAYDKYDFPDGPSFVYRNSNDDIPNWSRSIAAAWELVEEMISNRKRPKIVRVAESEWYAGVDHNSDYFGFADTAPRAICLAYIAWKEAQ